MLWKWFLCLRLQSQSDHTAPIKLPNTPTLSPIQSVAVCPCLYLQCFRKRNLAMRTWRSKALQWEKRDLLSRMRPKCGPNLELLRTSSRYFHQNAMRSLKSTFCDKSAVLFILEGMFYNPISQKMHALTLVLNLIDTSLSLFHSFTATFLSRLGK